MNLFIDETKLNLLLEQKKQYIGNAVAIDSVLSSVSLLITVLLASFDILGDVWGIVFKTVFTLLGIFFTCKCLYDIYQSKKNNYTYKDLLKDIDNLNKITSNHSLIVIRDTFNKYANRYLLYDDIPWDCPLFPNYKENENNESYIKSHLSRELGVEEENIKLKYVATCIDEKISQRTKQLKLYSHKFYEAEISDMPEHMRADTFEYGGRQYMWMAIDDMLKNEKIIEKNSDIVNRVKGMF